MSLAQRLKDGLPEGIKRSVRERRHSGERNLSSALLGLDPEMKVIFDVGANVGDVSLHFLRWFPGATVHAFEPASGTYAELVAKIEDAGFADRLRPHRIGFFNEAAEAQLHIGSHHGASSLIDLNETYLEANKHIRTVADETVQLMRLDDFVAEEGIEHIDLMKIDVEGVEQQVIGGGSETLRHKVDAVIMEMSFVRHERGEGDFIELFKLMHELGFAPAYLFDIEQGGVDHEWRLSQLDCVFRKYR